MNSLHASQGQCTQGRIKRDMTIRFKQEYTDYDKIDI